MMMPLQDALRERLAAVCSEPYFDHHTSLNGYSKQLFSWLADAAQMVTFQAQVGNNAYCYYGTNGNEGLQALANAKQFLRWATIELFLRGAPHE